MKWKRKLKILFLLGLFMSVFLLFVWIVFPEKSYPTSVMKTSVQASDLSLAYNDAIVKVPITIQNVQVDEQVISYHYQIHIDGIASILATYQDSTIEIPFDHSGNATFSLLSNEKIILQDIPVDVSYTILQEPNASYSVSTNENNINSFSGITSAQNTVVFTNTIIEETGNPDTYDFIFLIFFFFFLSGIWFLLLKTRKKRKFYARIYS